MAETEISKINKIAATNPEELVLKAEEQYRGFIREVGERVAKNDDIRIILLAGPSGSGKTTTANMLADGIRELGLDSFVISLDDFYRNSDDAGYPRLADGSRDFESPEALDLDGIYDTLSAIAFGHDFFLPKYSFKLGKRTELARHPKISHGCVIIEGLHALNPKISDRLPSEKVLKIFISVSTNINDGGVRILSGRKLRFVRRMVRDSVYRDATAERTLEMWPAVLDGEDQYLYPYRELADVEFDTFHAYEPCIMRAFAEKLISRELANKSEYAKTVISALEKAHPIDPSLVPPCSLMREFITGGIYEEFY